jgi:hypothetical protein
MYFSGAVGNRRYGGVGFAVRDAINSLTLEFHAVSERVAWIGGTWVGFPMVIICVYAPTQAASGEDNGEATCEFYNTLRKTITELPIGYGSN